MVILFLFSTSLKVFSPRQLANVLLDDFLLLSMTKQLITFTSVFWELTFCAFLWLLWLFATILQLFETFCNFLRLFAIFETFWDFLPFLQLFETLWHFISLYDNWCHFMSLFVTICHFMSLYVTLLVTLSHFESLYVTHF